MKVNWERKPAAGISRCRTGVNNELKVRMTAIIIVNDTGKKNVITETYPKGNKKKKKDNFNKLKKTIFLFFKNAA